MKDPNADNACTANVIWILVAIWLTPSIAFAYIGPGLSLGTLVFGGILLLSVLFAIYAVVWFPIKRRLNERQSNDSNKAAQPADEANQE